MVQFPLGGKGRLFLSKAFIASLGAQSAGNAAGVKLTGESPPSLAEVDG